MNSRKIKTWAWVHKWSSLVCTVFMLLLCITGLPLIFHHEIGHFAADLFLWDEAFRSSGPRKERHVWATNEFRHHADEVVGTGAVPEIVFLEEVPEERAECQPNY